MARRFLAWRARIRALRTEHRLGWLEAVTVDRALAALERTVLEAHAEPAPDLTVLRWGNADPWR